jgi:hypothetical protein
MSTRIAIALWTLAVVASPIYLLGMGMPQPGDFIIAAVIALVLVAGPRINPTAALLALAWFAYVFIVNVTWWVLEGDTRFLFSTVYYAFNLMTMLTIASMIMTRPDAFVRWTRAGLLIALMLESIAALVLGGPARSEGTFNNPNQLAYWAILIATCWLALKPNEKLRALDLGVVAAAAMLCLFSASRAGLLAIALLLAVAIAFQGIRPRLWPAIVLLGVIASIFAAQWILLLEEQTAIQRFGRERPYDTLAARGYDRIWLFPQYVILGAGEGAYDRFEYVSEAGDKESHSTPVTILFSYGIIGAGVLGALLWWVFRRAELRHVAYMAPVALYGVTHNGTRAGLLWAFFGIVLGLRCLRSQQRIEPDHHPAAPYATLRDGPARHGAPFVAGVRLQARNRE